MASSAGQKWLIGCGIGCGVALLVAGTLATGTCFFVRDIVDEVGRVEESHDKLVQAFGEAERYTPSADGAVPGERVETFLAVRAALEPERRKLHELFEKFPPQSDSGVSTFFKVVRGLAGMIDDVVGYLDVRNRVLLESGMGYGEYLYIYCVAYYAWLGHDPADGPTHDGERIFDGDDSTFGSRENYRSYRRFMLAALRNQLDSLPEESAPDGRERLLGEIDAVERDRRQVAWRDGLPQAIADSLEPFRSRLAESYDPQTNCFELPTGEGKRHGGLQWQID